VRTESNGTASDNARPPPTALTPTRNDRRLKSSPDVIVIPSAPSPLDGEAPQKNPQSLSRRPRADAPNILTKGVPQANASIRAFPLSPFENFSNAHAPAFGATAPKEKRPGTPCPPHPPSPPKRSGRKTRQSRRQRSPQPSVAQGPSTRPPYRRDRETASAPRPSLAAWQDRRRRDRAPWLRPARGPERRSPPPAPAKARPPR